MQLSRWLLALNLEEKQPTLMIYTGGLCGNQLLRDIAKSSVGTVHNIWQKFEATGDISEAVTRERERVLAEHHEILFLAVLAVHPGMYLSELCTYIHSATGTLVSNSTICRVLKMHG